MPKKAVKSGTQGRKYTDLKMHIDLTGSNKVSILDKSPLDKSPPTSVQDDASAAHNCTVAYTAETFYEAIYNWSPCRCPGNKLKLRICFAKYIFI